MSGFGKEGLYFLPLGGAEEVGFNLFVYAVDGKLIIVDTGYGFLNDDFPGMDMGMADSSFLDAYVENIEALFITHAHEDHFGAIANLWPKLKCPVYATEFTMGHIRRRLDDYRVKDYEKSLHVVEGKEVIKLNNFEVVFSYMVHATPQNSGLFIKTKYGNIVHATDWKFDHSDIISPNTDLESLSSFAKQGVDIFVGDSTNLYDEKIDNYTEMDIRNSLLELVPTIENTLVATCFPSNIVRLESLMLAAGEAGRTPVIAGLSLIENTRIAMECGYMKNVPKFVTGREAKDIPLDKMMYICAGSQGNYRSGLSRIVNEQNKDIILGKGDTIIFSSQIIPGNEEKIERMQEKLRSKGVNVISKEEYVVHTSGHGGKPDVAKMYEILKPKIVIPVHGDKKSLREHVRFANSLGIKEVVSIKNGDVVLYYKDVIEFVDEVPTDIIGIDRNQLTSINSELVKRRRQIMFNGSLFITAVFTENWQLENLQISSVDITAEEDFEQMSADIIEKMKVEIPVHLEVVNRNEGKLIEFIKAKIRKHIFNKTGIKPVVFMHFYKKEAGQ